MKRFTNHEMMLVAKKWELVQSRKTITREDFCKQYKFTDEFLASCIALLINDRLEYVNSIKQYGFSFNYNEPDPEDDLNGRLLFIEIILGLR